MSSKRLASLTALLVLTSLVVMVPTAARSQSSTSQMRIQDALNEAKQLNEQLVKLYQQGNYEQAIPLGQRALKILETAPGPNHLDVATSLNNLALLYKAQGNYTAAEPLHQRALNISETTLGSNHPDVANSLNNLALLYKAQGNYAAAEPLYQRALKILETALGPNHPDVATSLNNLAVLYQAQGNYTAAELLYQRALNISETALGPNHPGVAASLHNLVLLYKAQGNYAAAEPLYLRALKIHETALGPNHPHVATSLDNLASLYQDQGNYAAAELLYLRALEIYATALGSKHPLVATSLSNLASLYQDQGNYAAAEFLHQRALKIREKALGPNHPHVATSLKNLAGLYQEGNPILAQRYLQQGLQVEERNLTLNLVAGSDRQKQLYAETFSGTAEGIISLHLQTMLQEPKTAQLALTTILQRKGRILDLLSSNQQLLRQHLDPQGQSLLDQLSAAYRQLNVLTFNPPKTLSPEQQKTQIDQLDTQIQSYQDQLSRRSATFRSQTQPISLEAAQKLIPTNTALVEWSIYRPFNPKVPHNQRWGKPRYAAYILTSQGDPQGIGLGDAATIDQAIENFRDTLRDSQTPVEQLKRSARKLDALVMQPVRSRLGNVQNLLLSPDSALNLIPFEALVDERERYLVETQSFTYLTSGRDLLRLQTSFPNKQPPLLLADPYFDQPAKVIAQGTDGLTSTTRSIDLSQQSFPPLPGTEQEVNVILPLLNDHYPGGKALTGNQATKQAIEQIQSPQILHIATHGFFVSPSRSKDSSEIALTNNPLLFSGLLLAGFKLKSPTDNGILTALEVTSTNLLGTKLVVLSACNTGSGQLSTGEGVYGLRRALVIAGAESQLFSLWRIDDGFTPKMMEAYYKKLLAGHGRSDALRQTQLELLQSKDYSHPYYWASFIASGNWTPMK